MRKNISTIPVRKLIFLTGQVAFVLVFAATLVGAPLTVFSANELSFTADTIISLSGSGISFWVILGSLADSMTVESTYATFTLSASSNVVIQSYERRTLSVGGIGVNTDCNFTDYSKLTLPGQSTTTTVTVTPSDAICGTVGGSGGGYSGGGGTSSTSTTTPTTTTPTTTTGQVTVTASGGGATTLTTSESTTASAVLPVSAVSSSTDVKIVAENKTDVIASRIVPSGKSIVGSYAYNYTAATTTGQSVSTFLTDITLTFSYTDSQISGLNEDTLKAYYWDGTQWLALSGTVDKVKNTISATTNHFTYFMVMGESALPTTMAKLEEYDLKEGNLIRAAGDFDIFIISQYGYKRLFLNPVIFNMYGHLGGWNKVKSVVPATRGAFVTSNYYRYVDSPKVYRLEVTGEDTGILHWVNMTAEDFAVQGGKAESVFIINKSEFDWYQKGADLTSL